MGLEHFIVTDDGLKIENPRFRRRADRKMARLQRKLSRCQRGSNRRKTAVARVGRLHEKIARKRKGFLHQVSRDLVNTYQRIAVERLSIKCLSRGWSAKSVFDASWATFLFYLTYKAECAGRTLVKVDCRQTSQTCPACGEVASKDLKEREHNCSGCGFRCHRDQAAAMVVRQRAFRPVQVRDCKTGTPPAVPTICKGSAPAEPLSERPRSVSRLRRSSSGPQDPGSNRNGISSV